MSGISRRQLLVQGTVSVLATRLSGAVVENNFDLAARVLSDATRSGQVRAAAIYARYKTDRFSQTFGEAKSVDASFLLGSISKPITVAALMALYDQGKFDLDDAVQKVLPEFRGEGRTRVTIRHLLTHVSGLPDQLPENAELRSRHASLAEFVQGAIKVPLGFEPGTRYEYSSMAILLAAEIAQRLAGKDIRELVAETVLKPLGMKHSALGLGDLQASQIMSSQVEFGAKEAGGGSAESRNWDWNSSFWRTLGAPWGGAHASAEDIAMFLEAFLQPEDKFLRPATAQLMIRNHNPVGLESRGLGFDVGMQNYCSHCSPRTFGHTGSTGTIAWADPERDCLCVVLTTLPANATETAQHPRQLASEAMCRSE